MPALSKLSLSHLTAAEREVLRLLAAGHTAKSIASTTSRSVAAVNERLREARRKTGFGSSRELARALTDQETRDENIGMEPDPIDASGPGPSAGIPRGRMIGIGIAMALALTVAAALSLTLAGPQPAGPGQDVVAETLSGTDDSPRVIRDRFRAETRDAAWAAPAEVALRAVYARVPSLGPADQPAIQCAASLCQAAGRSPPNADEAANTALMATLQERSLAPDGLQIVASSFASAKVRGGGFSYVTYFRRIPSR